MANIILDDVRSWAQYQDEKKQTEVVRAISDCERRVAAKRQMIADANYELSLLISDACEYYRRAFNYDTFNIYISDAAKWLSAVKSGTYTDGTKLDKRKKYREQLGFGILTANLREATGIADLEIQEIIDFNFGQGHEVVFLYDDYVWYLRIPVLSRVDEKEYSSYGVTCFELQLLRSNMPANACADCSTYTMVGCTHLASRLSSIIRSCSSTVAIDV